MRTARLNLMSSSPPPPASGQPQWSQQPAAGAPSAPPPPAQPPQKKQSSTGSALIGLVVVVVLVWFFFFNNGQPSAPSAPSAAGPTHAPVVTSPAAVTFADIHLSGSGDSVPKFTIPVDSAAIAHFTYNGSGNFSVFSLAANGDHNDLLVNTIGRYDGIVLMDATVGEHSVAFEVTADSAWTATIEQPSRAPTWSGQTRLTGSGDSVYQVQPSTSGLTVVAVTFSGDGNDVLWTYSGSGRDLAINSVGSYSGQVTLPAGTFLLEINASGSWSVSPS